MDCKAEIDRRIAEITREQEIRCPFCDEVYDDTDDYRCVSYHGDGDPFEVECLNEACEKPFLVTENVRRTYETMPIPTTGQGIGGADHRIEWDG